VISDIRSHQSGRRSRQELVKARQEFKAPAVGQVVVDDCVIESGEIWLPERSVNLGKRSEPCHIEALHAEPAAQGPPIRLIIFHEQ
jgi:hypothetical protein